MTEFIEFDRLTIENIESKLNEELVATEELLQHLVKEPTSSWLNIMQPLQNQLYSLNKVWGVVGHLQSVKDSPELRELHDKFLPKLTELYVNLGQNQDLYRHIQHINDNELSSLNLEQQKVIANEIRDFRLSGITLPKDKQIKFKEIQNRLSELSTKFEHNVLDATDTYVKYVTIDDLVGVPEDSIAMYKAMAEVENHDGYKITLHMPSYLPIMQYADNRQLREELYKAYSIRASEMSNDGKFDNSKVIDEILNLRKEKSLLLGFNNYAELSLYSKMADTPQQVLDFLYDLANKAKPYALNDIEELSLFAKDLSGVENLSSWDIPYYSEKLQQHKYSYSSNELKQYFQLPKVLDGLYKLIDNLYQVTFTPNSDMPKWHNDVTTYNVVSDNKIIGHIYFDLYAREGKQPGAWMNSAQDRNFDNGQSNLPIAYIICNFTKPVGDKPSLLSFDDTQTLFHEIGHGLHHLLTVINNSGISGINGVEWDAVELPSQFMEYFAWDYSILETITSHIETGEVLPRKFFDKILASRYYQSGMMTIRQLEFSIFDLRLHGNESNINYLSVLDDVRKDVSVVIPPSYNRFPNSFGHIFGGGYAAGYYSYKWAEVLACDVFSVFDGRSGAELRELGQKYLHNILSQGGVRPMMNNFIEFMGREPKLDALLKYSGLVS
ncbi:MAG: M3 family metallopeptidase [Burkholderiales bacterium]|nr:M3 family metallopeptidase [Burkholderiales bacterium]